MTSKTLATETQQRLRQAMQLLRHLSAPGNTALICSKNRDHVILSSSHNNVSLSRGTLPADIAQLLLACGYVHLTPQKAFMMTNAGQTALSHYNQKVDSMGSASQKPPPRRMGTQMPTSTICVPEKGEVKAVGSQDIDIKLKADKRRAIRETTLQDGNETLIVQMNEAESPLAWLHKRRDRNGEPFIDDACFEAGERLRRDVTMAQVMPQVTSNWSPTRGGGAAGGPAIATDTMVSARQRLHRALDAVDGNYAGILLDVCGFLKGIEEIERERHWPPRSGKVVLKLALQRLATHYGLNREARGPSHSQGIRNWAAPL